MKRIQTMMKQMIQDESAQGATEYILLLVIVVGLAAVFKKPIMDAVRSKTEALGTSIGGFSADS